METSLLTVLISSIYLSRNLISVTSALKLMVYGRYRYKYLINHSVNTAAVLAQVLDLFTPWVGCNPSPGYNYDALYLIVSILQVI
jgi:hypothetical protein